MNLLLIILRLWWGLFPRGCAELQLVPVPATRQGRVAPERRLRCGWLPGLGWYAFHPLLRRRAVLARRWIPRRVMVSAEARGRARGAARAR